VNPFCNSGCLFGINSGLKFPKARLIPSRIQGKIQLSILMVSLIFPGLVWGTRGRVCPEIRHWDLQKNVIGIRLRFFSYVNSHGRNGIDFTPHISVKLGYAYWHLEHNNKKFMINSNSHKTNSFRTAWSSWEMFNINNIAKYEKYILETTISLGGFYE